MIKAITVCAVFVAVFSQRVTTHQVRYELAVFWVHPQQQVPVRCAIVMRLCYTNAVNLNILGFEASTNACPQLCEVVLRIARASPVVFVVTLAGTGVHRVVLRRAGDGVENADVTCAQRILFSVTDAQHELGATNVRVRHCAIGQIGQRHALVVLINRLLSCQHLAVAVMLFAAALNVEIRAINTSTLMHATHFAHELLDAARRQHAQLATPPLCITHAQHAPFERVLLF